MVFSGHGDARFRMLHLIRQHMNSLVSGNSQDSLRRHDLSDRSRTSSGNTSSGYSHDRGITLSDHRYHLDRSSGRRNRWCSYRTNRPRAATIRALERYGDQILIRSRFVHPIRTPTFTGTGYTHIPVLIDLNLRIPKLSTRHPPSSHPSTLSLPKTFFTLTFLTFSTCPHAGSQRPDRQTLLFNRRILDSLSQGVEYSRFLHRPSDWSGHLTSARGMSLQLGGGDVLRIDTPRATIPPSLLARPVVIPTCWGRHFYTSIDELYRCDRSTVITLWERRDSIFIQPVKLPLLLSSSKYGSRMLYRPNSDFTKFLLTS